jgi:phosphoribosylformimino-5-aminoimidazole carboxamide ribotide isomerase
MEDIDTIDRLGQGRIDFTVGSALDIFGGQGLRYTELVRSFGAE